MKVSGEVEVDETYIGGKARNMHKAERERKVGGQWKRNKVAVSGALERGGRVRTVVLPDTSRGAMEGAVRRQVDAGATVYSDAHPGYKALALDYEHRVIDHAEAYVDGRVHTNTIENFWSLVKRGLHGTYISVEPFHLFRYLDERCFTFNERHADDLGRFEHVLRAAPGKRLTFLEVTGKA